MSPPWMPLWIGDYLKKTRRLTTLEHGAYLLLIIDYWANEGLPANDDDLAQIVQLSALEWRKIRPKIEQFFLPGWKHERVEEELRKSRDISAKRRAAVASRRDRVVVPFRGGTNEH